MASLSATRGDYAPSLADDEISCPWVRLDNICVFSLL
jgi:hypothetical protein